MKGQVSIFVILGLIVLFSVGIFVYYKNLVEVPFLPVNENLGPVELFVSSCMQNALSEAVNLVGQQGGFIFVPPSVTVDPGKYVNPDGEEIIQIPLWFYRGLSYAPNKASVENEIERYVLERTKECINDFQAFDQYSITPIGNMQLKATLNKEDVSLLLDYPIEVAYRGETAKTKIQKFQAKTPVRLLRMLNAAKMIMDKELSTAILENFTLDLMASNPNIPFTGMLFDCDQKTWRVQEIRNELREMLETNLPRVRVKNINYAPFSAPLSAYKKLEGLSMADVASGKLPNAPPDTYEYLRMFWDLNLETDPNMHVGFTLPRQIDLLATPQENGVLRSNPVRGNTQYVPFLCINIYHFIYNVNFPVLISLRDDVSNQGEGFLFRFALPVTIKENEPYKQNYGVTLFSSPIIDETFCSSRTDVVTDIRAVGKKEGLSNMELPDVSLTMECYRYRCPIGDTMADEGSYRLRVNLPESCDNPFIIAQKEGYLTEKKQLTDSAKLEIPMRAIREVPFQVLVHTYNSYADTFDPASTELQEEMSAAISLSTSGLVQYKIAPSTETLRLVEDDVTYDLEISLVQGTEVVGGYKAKWTPSNVEDATSITFHIFRYVPLPFQQEEKVKMMRTLMGGEYKNTLAPELMS